MFSDDYRQDFINYFNDLYQQEWDKYQTQWIKALGKAIKEEREAKNKQEIQTKIERKLKWFDETTK